MWRIKMYGKFIVWLLKQVMKGPITILAYFHIFINSWKKECRREFGLALLYYILVIVSSIAGGLVSTLIMYGDDVEKQMLTQSMKTSFLFATGMFIGVIVLASYDKFLEEYEQSFTKLKE